MTTMAMTRRIWIYPDIVYEVTSPSAQRMSRTSEMVQSK
jgi:hypothetical protein